jgi:hypothetical protein
MKCAATAAQTVVTEPDKIGYSMAAYRPVSLWVAGQTISLETRKKTVLAIAR